MHAYPRGSSTPASGTEKWIQRQRLISTPEATPEVALSTPEVTISTPKVSFNAKSNAEHLWQ
jgi:hypothetical protein